MIDHDIISAVPFSSIYLVKFGKKTHLEEIQKGSIFLNTIRYFHELEKNAGFRGQADYYDSCLYISGGSFSFVPENGSAPISSQISNGRVSLMPDNYIYCLFKPDKRNIIATEYNAEESTVTISIGYTEEQRQTIKRHFPSADSALVLYQPKAFIDDVIKAAESLNIQCHYDKVQYYDPKYPPLDMLKKVVEHAAHIAYYKFEEFSDQQEMRFLFNKTGSKGWKLPISPQNNSHLMSIDNFFNTPMNYTFPIVRKATDE